MGSKKQTILVLNGRRYDALTGELVTDDGQHIALPPISDVVSTRPKTPVPQPSVTAQPAEPLTPLASHKFMDISRTPAHTKRRQPQRASTLVRSAVQKPKPGLKAQTKIITLANTGAVTVATVVPKWPASQVNPKRLTRAEQVAKSGAISKFSSSDVISRPAVTAIRQQAATPAAAALEHQASASRDLFERAIAAADSHTQAPVNPKKLAREARKQAKHAAKATRPTRHRLASVVAASVAVLAIGGLVGLQNKTALTLRFADAKAGFHAVLPNYQPDGYGIDSFNYNVGVVGTSFHNAASGRNYTLNQQSTNWDSQALLDNFVAQNYKSYQVLQSGQQIIYVYGKNDASWIKKGIWYQLTSNGSLSTSQVLSVASSI